MLYRFYVKNPAVHYLYIDIDIDNITENELTLQLPSWRPGRYELGNFAKNIKKFDAFNENDELLQWQKINKDTWKVICKGAKSVKITYSYYASELNAGSTFVDYTQIYCNPVNCCMFIPERMNEIHRIKIMIPEYFKPEDFKIATSLKKINKNTFDAANFDELADSPFIVSNKLYSFTLPVDGVDYHLHFNGECKPNHELYKKDFIPFIKECVNFFGGIHVNEFHFLFQILPYRFYHGVEHIKSTVIAIGPGYAINDGSTYLDILGVSCHELFHTWNIKTIRPVEMLPYDFTKENYARTGYVYEGITTYYGDKLLLSSGVFNITQYFETLEERINKHFHNYGRFNLSLADSSFETWLDGYVPGAPYRKVSIYDEGNLIAFMLDVLILKATQNKFSLRNVMLKLYNDFYKKGIGYTEENIKHLIEEISGLNLTEFYKNYIYGLEEYEELLKECCVYIGFELIKSSSVFAYEKFLGIKLADVNGSKKVSLIAPYSPAWKVNISPQDEIISINGIAVKNDINNWLNYFIENCSLLEITLQSATEVKKVTIENKFKREYFEYYHLRSSNELSENYSAWIIHGNQS
jgi:predicted metalloprotease with PDZ domain